ncbi:cbb3-type cytochrome oxidase assembly protein CcoS [Tumebacillus algifaecis]|uniref:Cbb3-type cytochrome oxidase assembly protein CcoS n=1 Tax=Tumebacillus algifaecis TaxID=1214604 RepID=A0A223CZU2_9BACL|nr:cbb3-type cytochrome oxidase assembly protein CcoS [Tumebacillus algifaecis]ASS74862.1 cbb3-type cytochrome oxidase assembly protein CcoS [Tumebacillus algifaecis]
MNSAAWLLTAVCLSMTGGAGLLIWWSYRDGQFDDVEGIKYRMLQEDVVQDEY